VTSRVAVVAARPGPLAEAVSSALAGAGAVVSVVAPPFADPGAAVDAVAGRPDVVVWADVDPDALRPDPLVGLGELDWDRRCEEPLRSALWLLQAAYPHLRGRDGRVVLVCPSVALEGASGLVPLATAAEGQRLLAKSAARRWGPEGITVNVVTVPVAALGADVPDAARTESALPAADALDAAAAAVVWLTGDGAAGVTGATIGADGGAVMAP
jgi:NAD(P)-dependent dehydrogenase (short-subunit alcohol dehydrogenase family)